MSREKKSIPENPNIIILMTDQQRTHQFFPEDWIRKYLPNYQFFLDNGVVFENNVCNTSPCGPSRASLFSGLYPATNGITGNNSTLKPADMNFTKVLIAAGYDVYYKGKFHMAEETTNFSTSWMNDLPSAAATAEEEDRMIEMQYGFKRWTSPDFGTALAYSQDTGTIPDNDMLVTLGAGLGNNDSRVVTGERMLYPHQESVLDFLKEVQRNKPKKPFCLIVSMLNPHDISLFPNGYYEAGYNNALFEGYPDFHLPDSYWKDTLATKPQVQAAYLNTKFSGQLPDNYALNYLKFYAYLHTLSDRLHQQVFNAIGDQLLSESIVIRMADHGEMGMSHGGLAEKNFSIYNEMTKVPMIWYHPEWFQKGKRKQMVSLIDLIPTLRDLTAASKAEIAYANTPQGVSYKNLLLDASAASAEGVLFSYAIGAPIPVEGSNSVYQAPTPPPGGTPSPMYPASSAVGAPPNPSCALNPSVPKGTTPYNCPANIYGIFTSDQMKYAVYFNFDVASQSVDWSSAQYEMYNVKEDQDPYELNNLLPLQPNGTTVPTAEGKAKWAMLHQKLTAMLAEKGITPKGWSGGVGSANT